MTKSELVTQQVFNFVGYRFDLSQGLVKPTQERWMVLSQKISDLLNQQVCLVRQFMSLIRATNSHREAGSSRTAPHAPYPVASEEALACPGIIREDYSSTPVPSSTPEVVVEPRQCPKRPTSTPIATRSSTVYRRLKRRLGCSLRRLHSKRPLVHARRRLAYKLAGTQGRVTSPKTV